MVTNDKPTCFHSRDNIPTTSLLPGAFLLLLLILTAGVGANHTELEIEISPTRNDSVGHTLNLIIVLADCVRQEEAAATTLLVEDNTIEANDQKSAAAPVGCLKDLQKNVGKLVAQVHELVDEVVQFNGELFNENQRLAKEHSTISEEKAHLKREADEWKKMANEQRSCSVEKNNSKKLQTELIGLRRQVVRLSLENRGQQEVIEKRSRECLEGMRNRVDLLALNAQLMSANETIERLQHECETKLEALSIGTVENQTIDEVTQLRKSVAMIENEMVKLKDASAQRQLANVGLSQVNSRLLEELLTSRKQTKDKGEELARCEAIGFKDQFGNSALHRAVIRRDAQSTKKLIELGADVNAKNRKSETPLMLAATLGNATESLNIMKLMMEHGARLFPVDLAGQTFLHKFLSKETDLTSAAEEFTNLVEYLIGKRAATLFNIRENVHGRTPLMLAAKSTKVDNGTVALLQSQGVDFTLLDNEGNSVISYFVEGNKNRKLLAGLMNGGTIKFRKLEDAIEAMDLEATKVLITLDADLKVVNRKSQTVLHKVAAFQGKGFAIKMIKFLIEIGANISATDGQGQTFLHKLISGNGSELAPPQVQEMAEFLVAQNAANLFNVKENVDGKTPLMLAAKIIGECNSTATLLRSHGVEFSLLDKKGKSYFSYLVEGNGQRSCEEIQGTGGEESGVYTIYLGIKNEELAGIDVYCDLVTDGGGWTVFQRRQPSTRKVDFERTWREYSDGFGILTENHWLGLDTISELAKGGDTELRVDLMDWDDEKRFAKYDHFQVDNETEKYRLHLSGYSGNAGDSLAGDHSLDGMYFSTKDRDNDNTESRHCAVQFRGAWWYNDCHHSNLNGLYLESGKPVTAATWTNVVWYQWQKAEYSLKRTEMKLRSNRFQTSRG